MYSCSYDRAPLPTSGRVLLLSTFYIPPCPHNENTHTILTHVGMVQNRPLALSVTLSSVPDDTCSQFTINNTYYIQTLQLFLSPCVIVMTTTSRPILPSLHHQSVKDRIYRLDST